MFDTQVTVVGNLVAEPRIAFTKEGQAVASFRLASTPRRFDRTTGEWRDGETLFASVTCWRGLAENVAASLKKGCAVIVMGRLSVRPYETKDGDKRQSVDIDAVAVGPELARAVTIIKRAERGVVVPAAPAEASETGSGELAEREPTSTGPTDWGWSGGVPSDGESSLSDGLASDDEPAVEIGQPVDVDAVADLQTAGASGAPPQLAAAGGRWRSRGSVG
jgi:single-strand DNA-binding protein